MRIKRYEFSVYIVTNFHRTVLYTGVTNDLMQRVIEHYLSKPDSNSFAGKYNAHYLVFYEDFQYIKDAIAREKEIKGWTRAKKEALIRSFNPDMKFLNEELFGRWPPGHIIRRGD